MYKKRYLFYSFLSIFDRLFIYLYIDQLRVLAYHDIKDEVLFEKQILYLKSNYTIIGLQDLENHLFRDQALPRKSLLITFDDGDHTVLTKALPIFKKHNISAVLFVISGLIGTSKDFWWSEVAISLNKLGKSKSYIESQLRILKNISNSERLKFLQSLGDFKTKIQLSKDDLKTLENNGISVANHSHSHPMFNKCTHGEIELELRNSKLFFSETGIGKNNVFAYPNGNYSEETERLLKIHGIEIAFLFDHRINSKKIDPLRISRIRTNSDTDIREFRAKVSGLHSLLRNINF